MINGTANRWTNGRFHRVSTELLDVMADEGRPMTVVEIGRELEPSLASLQLSVARVAGFIRALPGEEAEQRYTPTPLGFAIARRAAAFAKAQDARAHTAVV